MTRVVVDADTLHAGVRRLAAELDAAYPQGVLLVAVLKGSVLFLADLVRAMRVPVEVDFLGISAYAPDSGRVRITKDLDTDVHGRDVVLVEDIVDTGLTLSYLLRDLTQRGVASLATCALFDKTVRRLVPVPVDFTGFEVADEFLIGYGLDHEERYRNLDRVLSVDVAALRGDPSGHLKEVYRG